MQTQYLNQSAPAIKGLPVGPRKTRPRTLAFLPQISTATLTDGSPAAAETWTISAYDVLSGQTFSTTFETSSTTLGAHLDDIVAAVQSDGKLNDLFTVAEDGATVATFTARNANREYDITVTPDSSGSASVAMATTQAPGGAGFELGIMVAKGPSDGRFTGTCRALEADDTRRDCAGIVMRTDANHYHSLENDLGADVVDTTRRGETLALLREGRIWVQVEDAVTPDSRPHVRRAQTSNAGTVGGFRGSPAGSAQVATFAPTVDLPLYGLSLSLRDADGHVRDFSAIYQPTDGTTAVADAIDGLFDAIVDVLGGATSAANGLGVTVTESDTLLTFTSDAGVEIVDLSSSVWQNDTEAVTGTVVAGTADADAIDISEFAEFETSASAGGLALLAIDMGA